MSKKLKRVRYTNPQLGQRSLEVSITAGDMADAWDIVNIAIDRINELEARIDREHYHDVGSGIFTTSRDFRYVDLPPKPNSKNDKATQ